MKVFFTVTGLSLEIHLTNSTEAPLSTLQKTVNLLFANNLFFSLALWVRVAFAALCQREKNLTGQWGEEPITPRVR